MKKIIFLIIILLFAVNSCSSTPPLKFPIYEGGKDDRVRIFLKGKRSIGIVAGKPNRGQLNKLDFSGNWATLMEAKVESALSKRGYFTIVDLAHRKERLRQLAHSQSGLTSQSLKIGKEMAVKLILVVTLTNAPKTECKIEKELNRENPIGNIMSGLVNKPKDAGEEEDGVISSTLSTTASTIGGKRNTGIRYFSVYIQAKMIEVETGKSLAEAISAPYRHPNQSGNLECPSVLKALDGALTVSAVKLAERLSPGLIEMDIPFSNDVSDVREPQQKRVEDSLNSGITSTKASDMNEAGKAWLRAYSASSNQSLAATWNLAIYYWWAGQDQKAQTMFKKFFNSDNPDFVNLEKRTIWAKFKKSVGIK